MRCLQGSVLETYDIVKELAKDGGKWAALERKMHNRFFRDPPLLRFRVKDPFARSVLKAYAHYFIAVLTGQTEETVLPVLLRSLTSVLGADPVGDIDESESRLTVAFAERGLHFLGGRTSPYLGPYIWERTVERTYTVDLPDGSEELTVYLLSGFLMRSWLDFATFGVLGTGGWATDEGLFCVVEAYEKHGGLGAESFRVSFLKHEAQHVADYRKFPRLEAADLEYRAKLMELVYARSRRALRQFVREAAPKRELPHAFASHALVGGLSSKIGRECMLDVPLPIVRRAALQLYREHTERLQIAGADTVDTVL